MDAEELKTTLKQWNLNAAHAAKVLCVHTNKLSEYLGGVARIPCSVAFHIEALNQLPEEHRGRLFQQRINRKAHQPPATGNASSN